MKFLLAPVALCALSLAAFTAAAQDMFVVSLRGTASFTNDSGKVVFKIVTDRTLLQEAAQAAGLADAKGLALVYHVQGGLGDTMDIVDAATGQVADTLLGFYFGEAFDRVAITNSLGTEIRRLDYIYTKQNSHSLGSALVVKRYRPATGKAGVPQVSIQGDYQYIITPQNGERARICSGNFRTLKPFVPRK